MLSLKSLPKISLLVLLALSAVVGVLFYVGGSADSIYVGDEAITVPKFTDSLLYWSYILMGIAAAITIIIQVASFISKLKESPKAAIKSLLVIVALVVVIAGSFLLGSGDKIEIVGYEGVQNSGFWAKFTDMSLYSIYILLIGTVLAILGTSIYKLIKK